MTGWRRLDGTHLALAALVAVGAALRLYGLDRQSLWNDELSSWTQYTQPTLQAVWQSVPPYHAPAHWLLMHLWVGWLGDGETQLRLPSALAGIAAIPAMFGLGRRLYGRVEGLIAAALTATAWPTIYFSQEARPYMFLFLLSVLSSSALIDVVRGLRAGQPPPVAMAGYVLAAVLACYTHHVGTLFVALQALPAALALGRRPGALGRLAGMYAAIAAAYLPWLPRAAADVGAGPAWLRMPDAAAAWRFASSLFSGSRLLTGAVMLLAIRWALRAARAVRRGERRALAPDLLLIAWAVGPVALLTLRSLVVSPSFSDRHLVIVIPAAYLLVARAIAQLPVPRLAVPLVGTALPALLVLHLVLGREYYRRPGTEQFREAAAYLVARDAPGDAVIVASAWNRAYFDYYLERLGSPRRIDRLVETARDRAPIAALIAARSPAAIWLLAGHKRPRPELLAWLGDELTLTDEVHYRGAAVWRFAAKRPGEPAGDATRRASDRMVVDGE